MEVVRIGGFGTYLKAECVGFLKSMDVRVREKEHILTFSLSFSVFAGKAVISQK